MNIKIDTRQKVLILLDVHTGNELLEVYNFLQQLDGWEQYKIRSLESDDVRIKELQQFRQFIPTNPCSPTAPDIPIGENPYRVTC